MTRTPTYLKTLKNANNGGLTGRINRFNQMLLKGGLPVGGLGVAGATFAASPEMALASGTAGVALTALGGMGYAATLPGTIGGQEAGRERLEAFEPVEEGEDVLDILNRGGIDTARYTANRGFYTQDAEFVLEPGMVGEADPYRVLERMEENGNPTYLLRENGYRFTLAAVNTPYWNAFSYNRTGSIGGSGNYEMLEVHGDRKQPLGLDTAQITAGDDVVDAYVAATFDGPGFRGHVL